MNRIIFYNFYSFFIYGKCSIAQNLRQEALRTHIDGGLNGARCRR